MEMLPTMLYTLHVNYIWFSKEHAFLTMLVFFKQKVTGIERLKSPPMLKVGHSSNACNSLLLLLYLSNECFADHSVGLSSEAMISTKHLPETDTLP
jgi:hypothetical protein